MKIFKKILRPYVLFATLMIGMSVACTSPADPTPTPIQPTQSLPTQTPTLPEPESEPTQPAPTVTQALLTSTAQNITLQSEASTAVWREDLRFLADRMPNVHPNLYWRVSEAEFQEAIQNLDAQIPNLTDQQIIVEMARLVAFIDGHSAINIFAEPASFQLYPLRLFNFSDGLFIIDAQPPLTEFIGGEIVQIGGLPIAEVWEAVTPLVPHDNQMTTELAAPNWIMRPEVLLALGLIESIESPQIIIEMPDGSQQTLNPTPVSWEDYRSWSGGPAFGLPQRPEPLYLSRAFTDDYWFTYLEESGTLYIQYNRVQSGITRLARDLADFLENQDVDRVVLDLRLNPGGNNTTYGPFLDFLSNDPQVNRPGRFFTILGRQTFSAAANFATELENKTHTIFVGEPMGGSPNLFGDVIPITLPNSGLQVNVSARYWEKSSPEDQRTSIDPDLPAPLSSQGFFNDSDPAMAAILSFAANNGYQPGTNPILVPSVIHNWESADVRDPYVVEVDGIYYMFYAGQDRAGVPAIGYATSENGKKWFRATANPILGGSGEGFDAAGVTAPVVRLEDGVWTLYYGAISTTGGRTTAVGKATATHPNGPWQRSDIPVIVAGESPAWDALSISPGSVVDVEGGQRLYYGGFSQNGEIGIGFAESADGVSWTKYDDGETASPAFMLSDPVLAGAARGAWDEIVWAPFVQQRDGQWEMFYHGDPFNSRESNEIGLGLAISVDGLTWQRPDEPFLISEDDGRFLHTPAVWPIGDFLYVYYASVETGGQSSQIELAVLPQ